MKKILIIMLFCLPLVLLGNTITSNPNGGSWSNTATWMGGILPVTGDNVIINTSSGHSVTGNVTITITNLTINSGATLAADAQTITGVFTNNGSVTGSDLVLTGSGTVLTGGGSWTGYTGVLIFQGANQVIDASVSMIKASGSIQLNTLGLGGNMKITNNGTISLSGTNAAITNTDGGVYSTTWVNAAGSSVSVAVASWINTRDTLYASAAGNTVTYTNTAALTLKNPVGKTYYNLVITSSVVDNLPNSFTANSVTVSSGATLNFLGDSLFLTSTWSHPGTVINHQPFAADTAIIKVGGTTVQKIPPGKGYKITSTATGGGWANVLNWIGNVEPGYKDTAVIATTGASAMSAASSPVLDVIVNSGATFTAGGTITGFLNNDGSVAGAGGIVFTGTGTILLGHGSWTGYSGTMQFENANQIIDATVNMNMSGKIVLNTTMVGGNMKITNNGSITLSSATVGAILNNDGGVHSTTWVNGSNAKVSVAVSSWVNTRDTLYASATGDTVAYTGTSAFTIKQPKNSTYNNLIINSTNTLTLPSNIMVNNNLTISGGTLNCSNLQITGNSTGTFSMASGTSMILGLSTSSIAPIFPTNYTTANISLDPNSTVTYQADGAITQAVSSAPPSYGNLILSTGSTASTKTTSGASLAVAGNLTINTNTTLSGISGTLTLGGNFTDNGTYTIGSGTILLDGSGTQTIGGTSSISPYNLTISNTGTGKVQPTYSLAISNNLSITSGTLDVTSASYNLTIGGNFTNNGGILIPHGNTVTMDGSSQVLGGSSTIALNNLIIASGATTLGGNITTTSNITINTGATFNASTYNVTMAGNFTDNGTFNCNSSTFDFDNNGNQCVSGSHTSETFQNLMVSALSKLGTSCVVNIDGTILIQPGGYMACVCH